MPSGPNWGCRLTWGMRHGAGVKPLNPTATSYRTRAVMLQGGLPFELSWGMSRGAQMTRGCLQGADVAWNFEKWLCNRAGRPVKRYSSAFDADALRADIKAQLAL